MTSSGGAIFRVLGFASQKTLVRAAQLVQARARLQPHLPAPEPKAFPMYHIPICPTFKSIKKSVCQVLQGVKIKDFENEAEKPEPSVDGIS